MLMYKKLFCKRSASFVMVLVLFISMVPDISVRAEEIHPNEETQMYMLLMDGEEATQAMEEEIDEEVVEESEFLRQNHMLVVELAPDDAIALQEEESVLFRGYSKTKIRKFSK